MNVDFPLHFESRGRTALADEKEHVRDMLEQLVFTSSGERVKRPDFGSGLLQLVFAPSSPELTATTQFTLQAAIQRWLGDVIEVTNLEVRSTDSRLEIEIDYVIRRTGEKQNAVLIRNV